MFGSKIKHGCDMPLSGPVPHQPGIAARAERKTQGVKQYRFPGPRFAGQNRQTARKIDLKLFNEHNVADGEMRKHRAFQAPPVIALAALEIHEPAFSRGSSPPDCKSL